MEEIKAPVDSELDLWSSTDTFSFDASWALIREDFIVCILDIFLQIKNLSHATWLKF